MTNAPSIRAEYEAHGVQRYYDQFGATYRNPHEDAIRTALREAVAGWKVDLAGRVLDLACGSGEVTLMLRELGGQQIDGVDPYTGAAYYERTGQTAELYTFADIAAGVLNGRHYDLIVCSFALHLVENSRLPVLAYQLTALADTLLILTPHKRPHLTAAWGWQLYQEMLIDRVRMRLYRRT
jgi:SAM-dependent methyltransferase